MPLYNTATAAAALGVGQKWLDNFLSHHQVPGVQPSKQGLSRRLPTESITLIAVAQTLSESIGLSLSQSLALAQRLAEIPELRLTSFLTLSLDHDALRHALTDSLAQATDLIPTPPRGRPSTRRYRTNNGT